MLTRQKLFFSLLILLIIFLFSPKAVLAQVVINEVFYHGDNTKEWVELYNSGSDSVDVGGWIIEDNTSSDTLPAKTLPAGGFGVIITNNTTVTGVASEAILLQLTTATIGNGLADSGDQLTLKNVSSEEVDKISYGNNTAVFTLNGEPDGYSLERVPVGVDND